MTTATTSTALVDEIVKQHVRVYIRRQAKRNTPCGYILGEPMRTIGPVTLYVCGRCAPILPVDAIFGLIDDPDTALPEDLDLEFELMPVHPRIGLQPSITLGTGQPMCKRHV